MKAFLFLTGILFTQLIICTKLLAQDSIVTLSKIEQLAKMPGKLLYTEQQHLGSINNTAFHVVTIREVETGQVHQALQIASTFNRTTEMVNTNSVFIGAEDLQTVIRFMDTILPKVTKDVLQGERAYSWITPDDVEIRFHQLDGASDLYIARLYHVQRTAYTPSSFWFNRRRIPELASLLKSALTLMQGSLQHAKP